MHTCFLNIDKQLQTRTLEQVVENRTAYTLEHAELSIYETRQTAYNVVMHADTPVLASMIRGKKIMHLDARPGFEFLPGQSMWFAPAQTCVIDFPEASAITPTECLKLSISPQKTAKFCEQLNEKYPLTDVNEGWQFKEDCNNFINDAMISQLLNRLIAICTENNIARNFFANLVLQELVVRLMQTKNRHIFLDNHTAHATTSRFAHVVAYIQKNLRENITVKTLSRVAYMSEPHFFRCFKQQFGLSPVEFINEQRIRMAKMMLHAADQSVTEVSFACGYNNLNHFAKMFKRYTGLTPAQYRKSILL